MSLATQHIANLVSSESFENAPLRAKLSVLGAQCGAAASAIDTLEKTLANLSFLSEDHPTILSLRVALISLRTERAALECLFTSLL